MGDDTLKHVPKSINVDIGVKKEYVSHIAHDLTSILASCYILTLKSQTFHWIVSGPHFYTLHQLSQEHYERLLEAIDNLAERIRALGKLPPLNFSQMVKHAKIPEFDENLSCEEMLGQLLADHEAMARLCHNVVKSAEEADDIVTTDMLTTLSEFHEKAAWMLRVTLD